MNDDRALGRIEIDPERGVTADDVQALLGGMKNRASSAMAMHRMLEATGDLRSHTLMEYRCRQGGRGCLLARVFSTPPEPAVYMPAVRYSPERNVSTSGTARRKRTSDGERRWNERAELLGSVNELWLTCDHLLKVIVTRDQIEADVESRRGGITLVG